MFAADYIAALDGITVIHGGWINHHWMQVVYQLCNGLAGLAYSFIVTSLILFVMSFVPGCQLRVTAEEEKVGIDQCEINQSAYHFNFDTPLREITPNNTIDLSATEGGRIVR